MEAVEAGVKREAEELTIKRTRSGTARTELYLMSSVTKDSPLAENSFSSEIPIFLSSIF